MSAKDKIGLAFVFCAVCGAGLGYKILGRGWYLGFALLGGLGLWLVWSAARARKLLLWDAEDQVHRHSSFDSDPGSFDSHPGSLDADPGSFDFD